MPWYKAFCQDFESSQKDLCTFWRIRIRSRKLNRVDTQSAGWEVCHGNSAHSYFSLYVQRWISDWFRHYFASWSNIWQLFSNSPWNESLVLGLSIQKCYQHLDFPFQNNFHQYSILVWTKVSYHPQPWVKAYTIATLCFSFDLYNSDKHQYVYSCVESELWFCKRW